MRLDHFLQQVLQFELSQTFLSEKKKKKEEKENLQKEDLFVETEVSFVKTSVFL